MTLDIELLNKSRHNRKTFDCGQPEVSSFLQTQARPQMEKKINRTWVVVDCETQQSEPFPIAGYFTLTQGSVVRQELPASYSQSGFPRYPVPVIKLAWLGVAQEYQRSTYRMGETLLLEALDQAQRIIEHSGLGVAIVVDPLTEASSNFFQKYGFQKMERSFGHQKTLFLPIP
ncbi:MAG: acetyltransferase [Halomonadaceae bacterium]|nr:MAG: acetyltransferase [Halomonadaceae bacterium]